LRALVAQGAHVTMVSTTVLTGDVARVRAMLGPVTFTRSNPADLDAFLAKRLHGFDIVIVSRPHNMRLFQRFLRLHPAAARNTFIIYDAEAIFGEREVLRRRVFNEPCSNAEIDQMIDEEVALATGANLVVTVNEANASLFRAAGYPHVSVLSYATALTPGWPTFAERRGFLFVGPTYSDETPNSDSVTWFANEVLPAIRRHLDPSMALSVVGASSSAAVAAHASAGRVVLHGAQAELAPSYDRARVFVAPTRFAAGIALKVYDAAAHGVPVVLTSVLASQIGWRHDVEALIADSPDSFARACVRLHQDADLWVRLRQTAQRRIAADCDRAQFTRIVGGMLARATAAQVQAATC
jgi:glycosyltransferase involved in cell wall biosynthesis